MVAAMAWRDAMCCEIFNSSAQARRLSGAGLGGASAAERTGDRWVLMVTSLAGSATPE